MGSYVDDIKEFGTTISHDTGVALDAVSRATSSPSTAPSASASQDPGMAAISDGLSSFVSGISEIAQGVAKELSEAIPTNASRSSTPGPVGESLSSTLTMAQVQEKMNSQEEQEFARWMESFDLKSQESEIVTLLAENSSFQTLHAQLVPKELGDAEFWGRYYYKLEQALKKEEKRLALLNRTKSLASQMNNAEFSWDDDLEAPEETVPATEEPKASIEQTPAADSSSTPPSAQPASESQVSEVETPTSEQVSTIQPDTQDLSQPDIAAVPETKLAVDVTPVQPQQAADSSTIKATTASAEVTMPADTGDDVFEWS